MNRLTRMLFCLSALLLCFVWAMPEAVSQPAITQPVAQPSVETEATTETGATEKKPLGVKQKIVADKHTRFTKSLKQLAEASKKKDPSRTDLLYRALAKNSERRIAADMEEVAKLLASNSYGDAELRQADLLENIDELIEILESEKLRDILADKIKAVEEAYKSAEKLAKREKQHRYETQNNGKMPNIKAKQDKTLEEARKLAGKMDKYQDKFGKPKDGKPKDGKPKDGKPKDGKPKDGKPKDGKPKDGKPSDGKPKDGKPKDGKPKDGKPSDGKPKDGKPSDGKPKDGKPSDGKPKDGKPSDGKPKDGKPKDGEPSDGKPKDGKPSDGKPKDGKPPKSGKKKDPADQMPGRNNIENAIKKMEQTIKELKKKARESSVDKETEVIKEIEEAKKKLAELLRQLREEERMLFLADLQARFRKMLVKEYKINKESKQLAKVPEADRKSAHTQRATGLSRRQKELSIDAGMALLVLREDGSSAAFPVVIEGMQEDMDTVTLRLSQFIVDELTLDVEKDIITTLKELIDALQKEIDKAKEKDPPPPGKPKKGKPKDPKLVEDLAEIKLIRSMQARINSRTKSFSRMTDGAQVKDPKVRAMTDTLGKRESRLSKVAYDIASGKTK